MAKRLVAAVVVALSIGALGGCATSSVEPVVAASRPALARTVDLNAPGALEVLQRSDPAHYEKVRHILDGVLQQPDANVPRWIQASFHGRDVTYAPIVMTSLPPKRRPSFALDATRYEAVIVLPNVRGEIIPLR
jgi:hypothetical protein